MGGGVDGGVGAEFEGFVPLGGHDVGDDDPARSVRLSTASTSSPMVPAPKTATALPRTPDSPVPKASPASRTACTGVERGSMRAAVWSSRSSGTRMQAVGGDGEPVGHPTLVPAAPEELQVLAEVLPAGAAHLAVPARQVRLDGDALAGGEPVDGGAEALDHPDDLVAGVVGDGDEGVSAVGGVGVGAADAGHDAAHERLVRFGAGRGGVGVDLDVVVVHDHPPHPSGCSVSVTTSPSHDHRSNEHMSHVLACYLGAAATERTRVGEALN